MFRLFCSRVTYESCVIFECGWLISKAYFTTRNDTGCKHLPNILNCVELCTFTWSKFHCNVVSFIADSLTRSTDRLKIKQSSWDAWSSMCLISKGTRWHLIFSLFGKSCMENCNNHSCFYISILSSNIWSFIYSLTAFGSCII